MSADLFAPPPAAQPAPAEPAPCHYCRCARSGLSGLYEQSCAGCRAREIARGPLFFDAKHIKPEHEGYEAVRQAYRDALAAAGVSHEQVKAWAA